MSVSDEEALFFAPGDSLLKNIFASVLTIAVATSVFTPPGQAATRASARHPHPQATPHGYQAPADEYFGRLQMSYLGIANVIRDTGRKADANPENDGLVGAVSFALDALRSWERKYPYDPWLARTYFGLEQLFIKVRTPRGQQAAIDTLRHISGFYGGGPYGRFARGHLLSLRPCVSESAFPQPLLTSSPTSSPSPRPMGSGAPSTTPAPTPSPAATPINAISKSPPQEPIADPCLPPSASPVPIRVNPTTGPGTTMTPTPKPTLYPTPQVTASPAAVPSRSPVPSPTPSASIRPNASPSSPPRP
ncbi:MAG: hypothetical protein NVS1B14_01550 [Vulcanimicrobiaceae bacterium]